MVLFPPPRSHEMGLFASPARGRNGRRGGARQSIQRRPFFHNSLPLSMLLLEDRCLPSATLYTDQADYHPEETVLLTGNDFAPGATLQIQVTRPDGSIVLG